MLSEKKNIPVRLSSRSGQLENFVESYTLLFCCRDAHYSDFLGFIRVNDKMLWQIPLSLVSGFLRLILFKLADVTSFDNGHCQWFLENAFATFRLSVGVPSQSRSYLVTSYHLFAADVQLRICHPWIELFSSMSWLLSVHLSNEQWHPSLRRRILFATTWSVELLNCLLQLR